MTATLLYINFSPRSESVSRRLAEQFINKWSTLHPDARSISKDYGLSPVEGPSDAWIKANMTPPPERTVDQIDLLAVVVSVNEVEIRGGVGAAIGQAA